MSPKAPNYDGGAFALVKECIGTRIRKMTFKSEDGIELHTVLEMIEGIKIDQMEILIENLTEDAS